MFLFNTKMMQPHINPFRVKTVTLALVIFVCLFSLLYAPLRTRLSQVVYSAAAPALHAGNSVGSTADSFLTNFRNKQALVYENAMLRAENNRMATQVLDRNLLEERVSKLEELLGRVHSDNRVVADVMSGLGQALYDTLIIDVGSEHGIQNGDFVVYAGAGVIGEISETTAVSSKVKLFSSPGEEYPVLIGSHFIPASAKGKGDGNFEAKVPQGSVVSVGDRVVVSKGDLVLGTVQAVEQKDSAPFATVFFRSSFNPTEVRTVEVVVGPR